MNTTTSAAENATHPFERRGMGKAPFRFLGLEWQDICYGERILNRDEYNRTGIAATTKPGGTCAYCGTYIRNIYLVESACGKRSRVGCDCIRKVDGDKTIKGFRAARLKAERARRAEKSAAVKRSLPAAILAARRTLRTLPHPNTYQASRGLTRLDWACWMVRNAGDSGRARVAKYVMAINAA